MKNNIVEATLNLFKNLDKKDNFRVDTYKVSDYDLWYSNPFTTWKIDPDYDTCEQLIWIDNNGNEQTLMEYYQNSDFDFHIILWNIPFLTDTYGARGFEIVGNCKDYMNNGLAPIIHDGRVIHFNGMNYQLTWDNEPKTEAIEELISIFVNEFLPSEVESDFFNKDSMLYWYLYDMMKECEFFADLFRYMPDAIDSDEVMFQVGFRSYILKTYNYDILDWFDLDEVKHSLSEFNYTLQDYGLSEKDFEIRA